MRKQKDKLFISSFFLVSIDKWTVIYIVYMLKREHQTFKAWKTVLKIGFEWTAQERRSANHDNSKLHKNAENKLSWNVSSNN